MVQLKLPLAPPETDCPLSKGCVAPLCPASPNLGQAVWFPGEPVCRSSLYRNLPWMRTQQEISRLPGRRDRGYFTLRMLRAIRRIRSELRGRAD